MKKLTAPTSLPKVSAIDPNRYELAPVFDSRGRRRQDINDPLYVATGDTRERFGVSDVWIRRRIAGTIRPMKHGYDNRGRLGQTTSFSNNPVLKQQCGCKVHEDRNPGRLSESGRSFGLL